MPGLASRSGATIWILVYRWLMNKGFEYCRKCLIHTDLTFEHIIPQSCDGSNERENITILCGDCNSRKGSEYWGWLEPLQWPPPGFTYIKGADLQEGDWLPQGIIVSKSVQHESSKVTVWSCVLDKSYAMLPKSKRKTPEIHSHFDYVIVERNAHADFKAVFDRSRSGEAGQGSPQP